MLIYAATRGIIHSFAGTQVTTDLVGGEILRDPLLVPPLACQQPDDETHHGQVVVIADEGEGGRCVGLHPDAL